LTRYWHNAEASCNNEISQRNPGIIPGLFYLLWLADKKNKSPFMAGIFNKRIKKNERQTGKHKGGADAA
jgi:hypothetical protein